MKREYLTDGVVQLSSDNCTFTYERPSAGVLLVRISGHDDGQFGTATLDEIVIALQRERPLQLFVDARKALGAAMSVSEAWTNFFSTNQRDLTRVHVLVSARIVQLTVAIAQHLSRTGNLIQIYSDPAIFDSQLAATRLAARR